MAEHEKWKLQTGQLVVIVDRRITDCVLMRVTRKADHIIFYDRVKIIKAIPARGTFGNDDTIDTYLVEDGDILDVRVSKRSDAARE